MNKKLLFILPIVCILPSLIDCNNFTKPEEEVKVTEIKAICNKTSFVVGDEINKNNIFVTATYSNKTTNLVTDWTCEDFTTETYTFKEVGEKEFNIKYNEVSTTLKVNVSEKIIHVESVSLNKTYTKLTESEDETLVANILPNDATDKSVTWSSDDPSVASVSTDGKIEALKDGITNIRVTTNDGSKTDHCTVIVTGFKVVPFETCEWSDLAAKCTALENGKISTSKFLSLFTINGLTPNKLDDFIGKEKTTIVNNNSYKIRVVDALHGKDSANLGDKDLIVENGAATNKIATFTFEFENLISDSDGNSLAYQYNDVNNGLCNRDYTNSTLRYALNGTGNNGGKQETEKAGQILVAQKAATTWCTDTNYTKSIIDMLPNDLKNSIKTVQKSVGTGDNYAETYFFDKLFLMSVKEFGDSLDRDKGYGLVYNYYSSSNANSRKKTQIDSSSTFKTDDIYIAEGSGQAFSQSIRNYSGYNADGGSHYFTRSPLYYENDNESLGYCYYDGDITICGSGLSRAYPIAPCFCI